MSAQIQIENDTEFDLNDLMAKLPHSLAVQQLERLERALAKSVELQNHYAELLDMYDGGQRMTFTVEIWMERLDEPNTDMKGGE